MSTWQKFWIANGNAAVRRYVRDCGLCAIERATPIRQLMSDLPLVHLAAPKKPFFSFRWVDYLSPLNFAGEKSDKKARGASVCVHGISGYPCRVGNIFVTGRFFACLYLIYRPAGQVKMIYSGNASTFQAESKKLPNMIESKGFHTFLRKKGVNLELTSS